jgi:internalin A
MKLVSIKGIRMMENLEYLYLDANKIEDFAEIYNLSNLIELDVSRVQIDKSEHFFDITSIKHLYLKQCELDSLENMVPIGIESLHVSGNQVVSIDGFEKLQNLQKLYCDNNQITDISKLQYLNQLRTLDIRNNPILDLSVLLDLTLLKELKIDEKQYEIMLNEGIFDKISNYIDIIVWP